MRTIRCIVVCIERQRDKRSALETLVGDIIARRTSGDIVSRIGKTFLCAITPTYGIEYKIIGVQTAVLASVVVGKRTIDDGTARVIYTTGVGP